MLFFCKIKDTFFIFTNNFDLDILSMSAISHYWLLVGRGLGVLLNIFQCIRQPSSKDLAKMSIVQRNFTNHFLKSYILLVISLQLSWFFPSLLPEHPPLFQVIPPPTIVHLHGSCVSSLAALFPILYFTSPWPFCNYLFVLNSFTSSLIPLYNS